MSFEFRIFLAFLTCYRLSELIAIDDGPMFIFKNLRISVAKLAASNPNSPFKSLADFVHCPFCVGVWFSFLLSILVIFPSNIGDAILIIFSIAGAQTFLESVSKRFVG